MPIAPIAALPIKTYIPSPLSKQYANASPPIDSPPNTKQINADEDADRRASNDNTINQSASFGQLFHPLALSHTHRESSRSGELLPNYTIRIEWSIRITRLVTVQ